MQQEENDFIYKFSAPIQIKMSDLDPFAHVNNGTQCNFFDYGRSQYFEFVFGEEIDWMKMDMVLVHTELDFKLPIKIHDDIVCETTIYHFGHKSIHMMQRLKSLKNGMVKSTCKSVIAGFDREKECSIPINEKYKALIIKFEGMPSLS